jgi:hypothetical protein
VPLTSFGSELIDLTEGPDGVVRDGRPSSGLTNVERFRRKIEALGRDPSLSSTVQNRIFYLPAGRYLIERVLPDRLGGWGKNLWDFHRAGGNIAALASERLRNPFGASVQFPQEVTLWMAPGAVLVPDDGCIIEIGSPLVCEATKIFDLDDDGRSEPRGLVIFGERTPKVLPEWWGIRPGQDSSRAIQFAIDAAIHHRVNQWDVPVLANGTFVRGSVNVNRPMIPVELRGTYTLHRPVEVRGGSTRTTLLDLLSPFGIDEESSADRAVRREVGVLPSTAMGGIWQGREAQRARFVAASSFSGNALLRLVNTASFTLRNVAFDATALQEPSCLEITTSALGPIVMQGMAVRRCTFAGKSSTLVQLGPVPDIVREEDVERGLPPLARFSNDMLDASGLVFDECTFRPLEDGVGAMVRVGQSLPLRFHQCSFIGRAKTMLWLWVGTVLIDGCSFDNQGYTPPPGPHLPGFEPPDGADIFISFEPLLLVGDGPQLSVARTPLAACTTTACTSRSARFLSTANSPFGASYNITKFTRWPVVILNTRHLPRTVEPDPVAIRWGLIPAVLQAVIESMEDRANARMGSNAPLVVVGGQYQGSLRVSPGAPACAFVGPRNGSGELMSVHLALEDRSVAGYAEVFCLPVDQRYHA